MDVTDRACNLECVKTPNVREFVGNVKIILVDPPEGQYILKTCSAGLIALANMIMGALNFVVLLYTLSFQLSFFNNLHVLLCTLGFQLFIPSGILMMNQLNGATGPLKECDKKIQHLLLQVFGLGCACTGSVLVFLQARISHLKYSMHIIAGTVSCVFVLLSMLLGPASYFMNSDGTIATVVKATHVVFGVLAFLASSVCFVTGIEKKTFSSWLPTTDTMYILMLMCAFYTLIVIYTPIKKHICRSEESDP